METITIAGVEFQRKTSDEPFLAELYFMCNAPLLVELRRRLHRRSTTWTASVYVGSTRIWCALGYLSPEKAIQEALQSALPVLKGFVAAIEGTLTEMEEND